MISDEVRRKIDLLSPREREVLELFCEGLAYKEIKGKLFISESAVKTYMKAVRLKFGIDQLTRRETAIEINNTYCSALKELREQSVKGKPDIIVPEDKIEPEPKPEPQNKEKERDPEKELEIKKEKDKEKETEKSTEDVIKKADKKDEEKSQPPKPKPPVKDKVYEKKEGNQMKKTGQTKNDRFRSLKTAWRLISIAAIIFSGYIIYDRFFGTSPTQPTPSVVEPEASQEEITIADTEVIPTDVIQPTAIPAETVIEPPTPAPTSPPQPAILFEDDFETGLSDAWEIAQGNPIVVNGMLSTDQDTWLLVGDPTWKNYSVEFSTDAEGYNHSFNQGFNAIGVRASDIDNMYVYKWSEGDSVCITVENGTWNEVPKSSFTPYNGKHGFRITILDGKFTVYMDGVQKASFFSDKYSNGRVALKVFELANIDNFIIREILE